MKSEHFLKLNTKRNSKWIKGLNVRPETITQAEHSDINCSSIFFGSVSQGKGNKSKNKQMLPN